MKRGVSLIHSIKEVPRRGLARLVRCTLPYKFEIVATSLRHLEVTDCFNEWDVTISAPKLTVVEHRGHLKFNDVLPLNAPQLTKILFPTWKEHMIPPSFSHLTGFAQLENLTLHMFHGQMTRLRKTSRHLGILSDWSCA
ncbi:unnamed protein product [Prunus armeniaca]